MNQQDILRALDDCGSLIKAKSPWATPRRAETDCQANSGLTMIMHVLWMINQAREFVVANRTEKAFRWLGFVQGVLWALGLATIDEAKEANRPKS